jgi:hypothetical protein
MNLQLLEELFSVYLVLAIGYNLVSLVLVARTGKGAAPTNPLTGILFTSLLYVIYATGEQVSNWLYLFFLFSFTVLILSFGIIKHLLNYDEKKYFSRLSWLLAFAINTFGVVVLSLIIALSF